MLARFRPIVLASLALFVAGGSSSLGREQSVSSHVEPLSAFARSSLRFEPMPDGGFIAGASKTRLVLDSHGPRFFTANATPVTMRVAGGRDVEPVADAELPTRVNYIHGSDRSKWRRNLPTYARVTYPAVRDGIDLVFHGEKGQLEYDFVVAPGVDARSVTLEVEGGDVALAPDGALRMGGSVHERPRVYQRDDAGKEHDVAARYRIVDSHHVGFELAAYDRGRPVVIDPIVDYSSFLGGVDGELGTSVAMDNLGNAYITGVTTNSQTLIAPVNETFGPVGGGSDTFIGKVDPFGVLVYLTIFGGANDDSAGSIQVDDERRPVVAGSTFSEDLPTTNDAPQKKLAIVDSTQSGRQDIFIARLTADGSDLSFATYLDVATNDHAFPCGKVPVDPSEECFARYLYNDKLGQLVLDGETMFVSGLISLGSSGEMQQTVGSAPTFYKPGSADTGIPGAFVVSLANGVITAKRFFGPADRQAMMSIAGGDLFVTAGTCASHDLVTAILPGSFQDSPVADCEVWVARLDKALTTLKWGTWLGGDDIENPEHILAVSASEVYVAGDTSSTTFPDGGSATSFGDGFIVRFDTTKSGPASLVSTWLIGGDGDDAVSSLAVRRSDGHFFASGFSASTDFPTTRGASDIAGFILELAPDGTRVATHVYDSPASLDVIYDVAYGPGGPVGIGFTSLTSAAILDTFPNTKNLQAERGGFIDAVVVRIADGSTVEVPVNPPDAGAPDSGPDAGHVSDAGTEEDADPPNPSALTVTPFNAVVPPRGTVKIKASNGTPPYTFAFASNASNASVDASGSYVAGKRGSVSDLVRVSDSAGQSKVVTITVGPAVEISPSGAAVAQNQTKSFSATGGAGAPFTWSATAGTIDASGLFKAPASNITVAITATDALGNTGTANVAIGTAVAIAPANPIVAVGETIQFSAFGGTGAFTFSVTTDHGGRIDATTGLFTAGPNGNVTETVDVHDTAGNHSSTDVTVLPAPATNPGPGPSGETPSRPPGAASSSSSTGGAPLGTTAVGGDDGGCDCRTAGTTSPGTTSVLTAFLAFFLLRRRRK